MCQIFRQRVVVGSVMDMTFCCYVVYEWRHAAARHARKNLHYASSDQISYAGWWSPLSWGRFGNPSAQPIKNLLRFGYFVGLSLIVCGPILFICLSRFVWFSDSRLGRCHFET